jgi:hypothetical protein
MNIGTNQMNRDIGVAISTWIIIFSLVTMGVSFCGCNMAAKSSGIAHMRAPLSIQSIIWTDDECKALHNKTIAYTVITAALGVIGGSTGIATAVLDADRARWVTGGISVGTALGAAIFGTLLKYADDDFSTGCRMTTEAKPN